MASGLVGFNYEGLRSSAPQIIITQYLEMSDSNNPKSCLHGNANVYPAMVLDGNAGIVLNTCRQINHAYTFTTNLI